MLRTKVLLEILNESNTQGVKASVYVYQVYSKTIIN